MSGATSAKLLTTARDGGGEAEQTRRDHQQLDEIVDRAADMEQPALMEAKLRLRRPVREQHGDRADLTVPQRSPGRDITPPVGFQSPSQFSRDYARFFGASPLSDARRLRQDPELWVASHP